ncbi:hypothetical protein PG994_011176 [Apiospora phragmitis]|uniref:Uncharacterized protein n=1 Tax=Apiospora phragmitis TaxID=2905665 RepID=A0ABR1TUA4_9PEZI
MPNFTKPTSSQEPGLDVAKPQKVLQDIPLNTSHYDNPSSHPLQQSTGNAQAVGCPREEQPTSTSRNTRPKHRSNNDAAHACSNGTNKNVVNHPGKNKKTKQRSRHRSRKGSSPPQSRSGNARPPLLPSYVLLRQGDTLNRELDRVLRNGKMMFWQEYIFAGAFRKIREALLELGSRDEKAAPVTEIEDQARVYAREAFDRFKMSMKKV